MSPRAAAFPISETPSGLPKYSGKIVTMSMRSPTPSPLYYPERAVGRYCACAGSSRPGGGSMTTTPPRTSTSGTIAFTNGTRHSPP